MALSARSQHDLGPSAWRRAPQGCQAGCTPEGASGRSCRSMAPVSGLENVDACDRHCVRTFGIPGFCTAAPSLLSSVYTVVPTGTATGGGCCIGLMAQLHERAVGRLTPDHHGPTKYGNHGSMHHGAWSMVHAACMHLACVGAPTDGPCLCCLNPRSMRMPRSRLRLRYPAPFSNIIHAASPHSFPTAHRTSRRDLHIHIIYIG